ncbi:hypothetical protein FGO68_gene589 [Halteria grandinella]|uniref:Uncharacterized protein n=1 Tax=Halteria grandinella TaxID=5974 RepID=A0A8J8P8X9_HALGN|nr:hypothetical protein FGO68_gene589 [Halteria grandinella]
MLLLQIIKQRTISFLHAKALPSTLSLTTASMGRKMHRTFAKNATIYSIAMNLIFVLHVVSPIVSNVQLQMVVIYAMRGIPSIQNPAQGLCNAQVRAKSLIKQQHLDCNEIDPENQITQFYQDCSYCGLDADQKVTCLGCKSGFLENGKCTTKCSSGKYGTNTYHSRGYTKASSCEGKYFLFSYIQTVIIHAVNVQEKTLHSAQLAGKMNI